MELRSYSSHETVFPALAFKFSILLCSNHDKNHWTLFYNAVAKSCHLKLYAERFVESFERTTTTQVFVSSFRPPFCGPILSPKTEYGGILMLKQCSHSLITCHVIRIGAAKDLHVVENISYVNAEACLYSKSLFGDVLVNASVFLYPCIIGYAVISAGIIYIMCRNMADNLTSSQNAHPHYGHSGQHRKSSNVPTHILLGAPMHSQGNEAAGSHGHMCRCNRTSVLPAGTKPNRTEPNVHQLYWLDCDQAVGGLLNGSIVLGMTVVCLILFFIFKNRNPELAMLEVTKSNTLWAYTCETRDFC